MGTKETRREGRDAAEPRRRADAERNIAAILDAGVVCFSEQAHVSMAEVARAAGVGRVTLYAHFPSREALLQAVLDRAITDANRAIEAGAPDEGRADEAVARLIRSSWQVLNQHRRLFDVAQRELEPGQLRKHHTQTLARVEKLITRGQAEGVFRTDLAVGWLATTFYSLLHAAAEDVNAGRLRQSDVAGVLEATILPAFVGPQGTAERRRRG